MSYRTLTIKTKLSQESKDLAWSFSNTAKDLWNLCLEMRKNLLNEGEFIGRFDQRNFIPKWKKTNRYSHFKLCPSLTLQQTTYELDDAFCNYFKLVKLDKTHKLPRFRSRKYFHTLTFYQCSFNKDGFLCLGTNKSHITTSFKNTNSLNLVQVKLSYDSNENEFYLHIVYEYKSQETQYYYDNPLAFDLGVKTFSDCIDQDKNHLIIPNTMKSISKYTNNQHDRVRSIRDKCKKGSKRYGYLTKVMRKISLKGRSQIKQTCHVLSKTLVEDTEYTTFVVGDLSIKDMTKSTQESELPKRVKRNINKAIHKDWPINLFINYLTYKSSEVGKQVVKINERGTTRTCHLCGYVHKNGLDPSVRTFFCPYCMNELPRDTNASINILNKYLKENTLPNGRALSIRKYSELINTTLSWTYKFIGRPKIVSSMEVGNRPS